MQNLELIPATQVEAVAPGQLKPEIMVVAGGLLGFDAWYCDRGWFFAFWECRDCLLKVGHTRAIAFTQIWEAEVASQTDDEDLLQLVMPPNLDQQWSALAAKRDAEGLTEAEKAEMVAIAKQGKDLWVRRFTALTELAKIYGVPVDWLLTKIEH